MTITGGAAPISIFTCGGAIGSVAFEITGDLAAAGGVADGDGVLQVQRQHHGARVVGAGVHLVAAPVLVEDLGAVLRG